MHGKEEIKQYMTKADFLLIGICLLTAALLAVWFAVGRRPGRTLRISCDGEVAETVALDGPEMPEAGVFYLFFYEETGTRWERFESCPEVPEEVGYNLLFVSGDSVSMVAADCRDQICVHHRPISAGGESIICLPHRLVSEITGDTDEDRPDGIVKAGNIAETHFFGRDERVS